MRLLLLMVFAAGCSSLADAVNEPGSWTVTFLRVTGYETTGPAPEYPTRVMTAPTVNPSGCTAGCDCRWVPAVSHSYDDDNGTHPSYTTGGFTETCDPASTILDCLTDFDSATHATGSCQLDRQPRSLGSTLASYRINLTRVSRD